MGSQDDSQEKSEEATPRKLRDARKKGQVAKSKDLNSIILLLITFATLWILRNRTGDELQKYMNQCFEAIPLIRDGGGIRDVLLPLLKGAVEHISFILAPILMVVASVALLVSYLQVGAIFSIEPIKPTFDKINPVKGFKNIFKLRSFIELIKSAAKISIVFLIAFFVIKGYLPDLILSVTQGIFATLTLAGKILASFVIKVAIFFIIIALFDLLYQRWQYGKDLKMSKYEVMQEYKRDEGDPLLKSHRKQMHQELTKGDIAQVAKSDVVVVNPVHLAIAILYDRTYMIAPQVMVKGQRLVAEQIKNLARQHNVPIIENVPLAHALFELDPGDEIPEEIYEAMAEVLSFIYRLKKKREYGVPVKRI
jgi:flagellar biosynthetic protein FlhB